MVYGPGGYRFGDYVRLGLPLTVLVLVVLLLGFPLL
jgi:di/tricarboxylate transporter